MLDPNDQFERTRHVLKLISEFNYSIVPACAKAGISPNTFRKFCKILKLNYPRKIFRGGKWQSVMPKKSVKNG